MLPFVSRLMHRISLYSTWKRAWLWLISSQVLYLLMIKVTIPGVEAQARGMKLFDLMPFGYSPSYALHLLNSLGEKGRNLYITTQLPLDFIYPVLFGISGAMFLALLAKKVHSPLAIASLIPLLAAGFDYGENILILAMIKAYPSVPPSLITASSTITIIKSFFTTLYLSLLLLLIGIVAFKRLQARDLP